MVTCTVINVILIFMNLNIKEHIALKRNWQGWEFSREGYKQLAKPTSFSLDSHKWNRLGLQRTSGRSLHQAEVSTSRVWGTSGLKLRCSALGFHREGTSLGTGSSLAWSEHSPAARACSFVYPICILYLFLLRGMSSRQWYEQSPVRDTTRRCSPGATCRMWHCDG